MLLAPTCFNLKCCEVAKNIRIIHVKVGLCVCVCVLLHYHMLQIQKGLTSPSVLLRDRFCTIISDFKGNSSSCSLTFEFTVLRKNPPVHVNTASVSQSMMAISNGATQF